MDLHLNNTDQRHVFQSQNPLRIILHLSLSNKYIRRSQAPIIHQSQVMVQSIQSLIQHIRDLSHCHNHNLKLQIAIQLPNQHTPLNQSSSNIKETTTMPFTSQHLLHQSQCPLLHQIQYIQHHQLQLLFISLQLPRSQFITLQSQQSLLTILQSQQSQPTNQNQQLNHHIIHLQHRSLLMLHPSLHMPHQSLYISQSLATSPLLQSKHTMNHHPSHLTILHSSHIKNPSKHHISSTLDILQFISTNSLQF